MIGSAVLVVIALVGIVTVLGWVGLVSIGIRRGDRGVVINTTAVDPNGTGPGRVDRVARQATGLHWV
jgi:hypothetical protein